MQALYCFWCYNLYRITQEVRNTQRDFVGIFFPERFYTDYKVKTLVSVSLLPLYCMSYITFISVLIDSLILNLRHVILTTFYLRKRPHIHLPPLYLRHFHNLHFFFFATYDIPSKYYITSRTNHTKVCSLMKNLTSLAPR